MKTLISVLLIGASCFAQELVLQPEKPTATITGPMADVYNYLANGSNYMVGVYGIYNPSGSTITHRLGGGVFLAYKISEYAVVPLRFEYLDNRFELVSGNLQLQIPITFTTNFSLVPFIIGGVGTTIGSDGVGDGEPVGIMGFGTALRFGSHFDALVGLEKRTGFDKQEIVFGLGYKFAKW